MKKGLWGYLVSIALLSLYSDGNLHAAPAHKSASSSTPSQNPYEGHRAKLNEHVKNFSGTAKVEVRYENRDPRNPVQSYTIRHSDGHDEHQTLLNKIEARYGKRSIIESGDAKQSGMKYIHIDPEAVHHQHRFADRLSDGL